ncbi:hypothetical protein H632_c1736p0, partial [Helicosporidium sp. ATCC 50920]
MRVWTVSDIHTDYKDNLGWTESLTSTREYENDSIIVAGDPRARAASRLHDWDPPSRPYARGKLELLESICQRLHVHTAPARVGGVWIFPLLSWYHSSWDREPDVPGALPIDQVMMDFFVCSWRSQPHLSAQDESIARHLDALNEPAFQAALAQVERDEETLARGGSLEGDWVYDEARVEAERAAELELAQSALRSLRLERGGSRGGGQEEQEALDAGESGGVVPDLFEDCIASLMYKAVADLAEERPGGAGEAASVESSKDAFKPGLTPSTSSESGAELRAFRPSSESGAELPSSESGALRLSSSPSASRPTSSPSGFPPSSSPSGFRPASSPPARPQGASARRPRG